MKNIIQRNYKSNAYNCTVNPFMPSVLKNGTPTTLTVNYKIIQALMG